MRLTVRPLFRGEVGAGGCPPAQNPAPCVFLQAVFLWKREESILLTGCRAYHFSEWMGALLSLIDAGIDREAARQTPSDTESWTGAGGGSVMAV